MNYLNVIEFVCGTETLFSGTLGFHWKLAGFLKAQGSFVIKLVNVILITFNFIFYFCAQHLCVCC